MTKQTFNPAIQFLTEEQLPAVLALQDRVREVIDNPDYLQPLTEEEYLYILRGNGMMAGAYADGRLIAFRAMVDPGEDADHLGADAGLPESEFSSVLYSEISGVEPDFRGHGLQTKLGKWLFERVDTDRYRYICTTVAPLNIPSLKDKFALGLRIVGLRRMYGEKLRYILFDDLKMPVREAGQEQTVRMDAIEKQQELIGAGWIGERMEQQDQEWYVVYKK